MRSLRLPLLVASTAIAASPVLFAACVGDDPTPGDGGAVPTPTSTGTSTAPPSDASTAADTAPPTDAAPTSDAGADAGSIHYVFVTSSSTNGAFAADAGASTPWSFADERCNRDATAAGLAGRYVAWLSYTDSAGTKFNAIGRIADHAYYVPGASDGSAPLLVASSKSALVTNGPIVPIDRLASGGQVDFDENPLVTYVWTGSNGDGTAALQDCNGWTNGLGSGSGVAGNARRIAAPTPTDWTSFGGRTCDARRRFYCFQLP